MTGTGLLGRTDRVGAGLIWCPQAARQWTHPHPPRCRRHGRCGSSGLRATGFGAVNLASVLFGTAAAPSRQCLFSQRYDDNLRTAFLIVPPLAYVGSTLLIAARTPLDRDTQRLVAPAARTTDPMRS